MQDASCTIAFTSLSFTNIAASFFNQCHRIFLSDDLLDTLGDGTKIVGFPSIANSENSFRLRHADTTTSAIEKSHVHTTDKISLQLLYLLSSLVEPLSFLQNKIYLFAKSSDNHQAILQSHAIFHY